MAQPSPWYGKVVREGRIHGKVSATGWGDSAATPLSGSSAKETRHDVLPDAILFSTLAALGGRTQCVITVSCSRETVTAARAPPAARGEYRQPLQVRPGPRQAPGRPSEATAPRRATQVAVRSLVGRMVSHRSVRVDSLRVRTRWVPSFSYGFIDGFSLSYFGGIKVKAFV